MPSARDKCFKKAVENLKDNGKLKDLRVQDQQRWVKDAASKEWSQTSEAWYDVVRVVSRVRKAIEAKLDLAPGDVNATRIPDMTVTPDGGKPIVIDNKFDGDRFRPDQLKDYNKINEQQNGDPNAKGLQLNSDVCKCGEPGALDPVMVPKPMPFMVPAMPGEIPALGGAAAPIGEPMFPGWAPAIP